MWKYLECSTPCVEAHFAFPDPSSVTHGDGDTELYSNL